MNTSAVSAAFMLSVILFSGVVPALGEKPVITLRSGTMENDDIAEPLSRDAKKYKPFLDTSNAIIKKLKQKAYGEIYDKNFHSEFAQIVSSEKFTELNKTIYRELGPVESYKPMQWYFALLEEGGKDIFISVKIVHHRAAIVYYRLTFYPGNPKQIIGFYYNVKDLRVKVKS